MTVGIDSAFTFCTPPRIIFGAGTRREIAPSAAALGRHVCLVAGTDSAAAQVQADLAAHGVRCTAFRIANEPRIEQVSAWSAAARAAQCDVVIGLGGGSAMDAAKAIAALLTNPGEPLDYLEIVGRGRKLTQRSAPCIAVPTTAGTGAEATVNAVLHAADQQVKVSMRSPLMLVETVIVDPALALTLPPHVTACAGLDAVTQLLEAFVSTGANPLTDALCRQGLVCAGRSLVRAVNDGADLAARTDMALAALCSGIALANARLGAVHGLAAPLGGLTGAAHGALCGRLLPAVTAVNLRALRRHAPHSPALARYTEAARLFLADADASTDDFTDALWRLCRKLHIPTLRELGITDETRDAAIPAARNASSMKTNPIALTDTDLYDCFHDTATTVASSSGEVAQ